MVKVTVIEDRMKELGIRSREELAERANVSRQTVWNLLNERHTPELKTVLSVAKALELPVTAIIEEVAA